MQVIQRLPYSHSGDTEMPTKNLGHPKPLAGERGLLHTSPSTLDAQHPNQGPQGSVWTSVVLGQVCPSLVGTYRPYALKAENPGSRTGWTSYSSLPRSSERPQTHVLGASCVKGECRPGESIHGSAEEPRVNATSRPCNGAEQTWGLLNSRSWG